MATGNVKWFDNRKGWGFITQSDGEEVFVHYRNIDGDGFRKLKDGQEVEFDVVQGEKGLYAENVKLEAPPQIVPGGERAKNSRSAAEFM